MAAVNLAAMDQLFDGCVTLQVFDYKPKGPWALPRDEPLSVGRLDTAGLHISEPWVPSRLCRFLPFDRGWVVQLGRARATVGNKYIGKHTFGSRAVVALQPGRSLIHFPELDNEVFLKVSIGAEVADGLDVLRDGVDGPGQEVRTEYGAHCVNIPDSHRRVLAVTYRYLLAGETKPDNVALAAGQALGMSEQAVKNVLTKTRQRVNKERWLHLRDADHLGHYLCRLSRTISYADLPEELQ